MKIERVELKRLQVYAQARISEEINESGIVPQDLKFDVVEEAMRGLLINLRATILAEDEPFRHIEIEWPQTWWQHFKDACYKRSWIVPIWWKKKWPVRWARQTVDVEALYPFFKQKVPADYGGRAVLSIWDKGSNVFTEGMI